MPSHKNGIFKTLVIVVILVAIFLSSRFIFTTPFRTKLVDSAAPALENLRSFFTFPKNIMPFASLREENKILKKNIEILKRRLEEMKVIAAENDRLKVLLDFKKTLPYSTVPAQVIGRDASNWSNSLIINKGSSHGVRPNKAALSTKGLAGRVVEVGKYSSKILLITDPDSKVGVLVERNRQGGILVGRPDSQCRMIYISPDSDVAVGDKVITAGFGSAFPKGIPVGEVVKVDKESGRLYKYAVIKPSQDLSKLEEIFCIK